MTKRIYALIIGVVLMCGLLLAAVLVPPDVAGNARRSAAERPEQPPDGVPVMTGRAWIPGGKFLMGSAELPPPDQNPDRIKPDEFPAHPVELDSFWMDEHEVTNREFAEFVALTGYKTFAETVPTKEDLARSGLDISLFKEEHLKAGSMCFNCEFDRNNLAVVFDKNGNPQGEQNWEYGVWKIVDGADWLHPEGPDSGIDGKLDHPVVHVNWEDAVAYCSWMGKRLPIEAEFEYASRSGKDYKFPWGDEREPDGKYMCNYWQGVFPIERKNLDGFQTSAPVKSFPPNEFGLYDMGGNVWEWCQDYFHTDYYAMSPRKNPQGPEVSFDSREPGIIKRVQRGGSFMCNTNSCTGYRTRARMAGEFTSSTFHTGFRGVVDRSMLDTYRAAQARIQEWRESQQGATHASSATEQH